LLPSLDFTCASFICVHTATLTSQRSVRKTTP
jgi:hypothetical protein